MTYFHLTTSVCSSVLFMDYKKEIMFGTADGYCGGQLLDNEVVAPLKRVSIAQIQQYKRKSFIMFKLRWHFSSLKIKRLNLW